MAELSRVGRDFGSWSPFGQGLPEERTIMTVNPKETVLGDFTSPPIVFENGVPPQLPAPSLPLMLFSLDNVLPPPVLRSVESEKRVDYTSRRGTDIHKNKVVTARPFTCPGNCGDSKW
jgi:hypothetical protein